MVARQDELDVQGLRTLWDKIREQAAAEFKDFAKGGLAVVLGTRTVEGTPLLMAAATPEAVAGGFDAGAIIKQISPAIKGGGGGKAAMAQAGGKDVSGLDAALDAARAL